MQEERFRIGGSVLLWNERRRDESWLFGGGAAGAFAARGASFAAWAAETTGSTRTAGATWWEAFQAVALVFREEFFETGVDVFLQIGEFFTLIIGQFEQVLQGWRQHFTGAEHGAARSARSTARASKSTGSRAAGPTLSATRIVSGFFREMRFGLFAGQHAVFVSVGAFEQGLQALVGDFLLGELAILVSVELKEPLQRGFDGVAPLLPTSGPPSPAGSAWGRSGLCKNR